MRGIPIAAVAALAAAPAFPARAERQQQVPQEAVVVPQGLDDKQKGPGPAATSDSKQRAARQPLDAKDLESARNASHPQVRRARELLRQWNAEREGPARPPLELLQSEPGALRAKAAAQATREYREYYRLGRALDRSRNDLAESTLQSLTFGSHRQPRLPIDPCGRVAWLAHDLGLDPPVMIKKQASKRGDLAGALGLIPEKPSCGEHAETLVLLATRLQSVFGGLPSWSIFERQWLARIPPTARRGSRSGAEPRGAAGAPGGSPAEDLGLEDLTAGGKKDSDQPAVPLPAQAPKGPKGRANPRLRYSGH